MTDAPPLHLAVALDGAGWHPAAWREPGARPAELFDAGYWTDLVGEAERGLLDLITIEDSFGLQTGTWSGPEPRTDRVRGRLEAQVLAARIAPTTNHIGVVPTAVVTHTEPFHASKSIATLDYVSTGRAGVRVQVSARAHEAALIGRREIPPFAYADRETPAVRKVLGGLFDEARDWVEVIRRLWDSWEDDAEIRDTATGRFVDVDKLHYIDFEGPHFSVRGPSITPRPPQGQPVVTLLAHNTLPYRLAATSADVVFVTPHNDADASAIVAEVRAEEQAADRRAAPLLVWGELDVVLDDSTEAAKARLDRLNTAAGQDYRSDAQIFAGTAENLAELLVQRSATGLSGFRLRPAVLPDDLVAITRELVPALQRRGVFREQYAESTLRERLGLARPANRYAA